jgi:hypothetical protein
MNFASMSEADDKSHMAVHCMYIHSCSQGSVLCPCRPCHVYTHNIKQCHLSHQLLVMEAHTVSEILDTNSMFAQLITKEDLTEAMLKLQGLYSFKRDLNTTIKG